MARFDEWMTDLNRTYNQKVLTEDIAAVKKMFPDIPDDKFYEIIKLDPTYTPTRDSVGIYGKWILNLYKKKALKDEDFYKVTDYLEKFHKNKAWFTNKDIGQFKSLPDLADALANLEIGELSANQKQKQFHKEIRKADLNAEKVFEDETWEVYIPNDYTASCKLATDTEWCTGPSSKGNDHWYKQYTKAGPLYIILNKHDAADKYQFHIESSQYMDSSDRAIDIINFLGKPENKGLYNFFMPKMLEAVYKSASIDPNIQDADKPVVATIKNSDFLDCVSEINSHHRDDLTGKWICEFFEDDVGSFGWDYDGFSYSEASYAADNVELPEKVVALLEKLGITNVKNVESLVEVLNADNGEDDPKFEDIRDAFTWSMYTAEEMGAIEDCKKSIISQIKNCIYQCTIDFLDYDSGDDEPAKFTFTNKAALDSFILQTKQDYEDTYYGPTLTTFKEIVCEYMKQEVSIDQKDYYGTDMDAFMDRFMDELYEINYRREQHDAEEMKRNYTDSLLNFDGETGEYVKNN